MPLDIAKTFLDSKTTVQEALHKKLEEKEQQIFSNYFPLSTYTDTCSIWDGLNLSIWSVYTHGPCIICCCIWVMDIAWHFTAIPEGHDCSWRKTPWNSMHNFLPSSGIVNASKICQYLQVVEGSPDWFRITGCCFHGDLAHQDDSLPASIHLK